MGRTPFTWERGNHMDSSPELPAPSKEGMASLPRSRSLSGKGQRSGSGREQGKQVFLS